MSKARETEGKAKREPGSVPLTTTPTSTDVTMAASRRSLNTTELLEAILKHLDTKTLLFSQRVNRNFRNVIQRSRALRQRLFLELAATAEILEPDFNPNQSASPYILVTPVNDFEDKVVSMSVLKDKIHNDKNTQPAVLNPLLFDETGFQGGKTWPAQMDLLRDRALMESAAPSKSSSLRQMYLSNPMPALVRVRYAHFIHTIHGRDRLRPRTFGEIIDEGDLRWREWYQVIELNGRRMPKPPNPLTENKRSRKRAIQKMDQRDEVGRKSDRQARRPREDDVEENVWTLFE